MNARNSVTIAFALLTSACSTQVEITTSAPARAQLRTIEARAEIAVPKDFETIQAALDAAVDGDTVVVAAGSYSEDLILAAGVTLAGEPGGGTVLFGTISATDLAGVSVQNMALDGSLSAADAVGVHVLDSAATLTRLTIDGFAVGILIERSGSGAPQVTSFLDQLNVRTSSEAGLRVLNLNGLSVTNSIFAYHTGHGLHGVFGPVAPSAMIFANNLFFANGYGSADGAGVRMDETVGFALTNNIIVSNNNGLFCKAGCKNDYSIVWGNLLNYAGDAVAGANNITKDPRFTNPAEQDFTPLFDSPAIDAGEDTPAPDHDFAGTQRPLGEATDIGPFEFLTTPGDLTIALTEIMANPLIEKSGEYIELLNFGTEPIDVAGWVIDDGDSTDRIAGWDGGTTVIPGGAYAVVLDPDYETGTYDIPAEAVLLGVESTKTIGSGLSNSDPVRLYAEDGITPVDSYSFPFDAGNGISVEKDSLEDGDALGNWVPSPCGRTPGKENCASLPPNVSKIVLIAINEIMANPLDEKTGEFIELYNFGPDPIDVDGFVISDGDSTDLITGLDGGTTVLEPGEYGLLLDPDYAGQYDIDEAAILLTVASTTTIGDGLANNDPVTLLDTSGLTVIDTYTHTLNAGNGTSVAKIAPNIGDISSNYTASTCASGSSPGTGNCVTQDGVSAVQGDTIAIMEVMANAIDEDTGEYIELLNYGTEDIDLAGFRISDGDTEEPLSGLDAGPTVLAPGGYALILDAEYAGEYDIPEGTILLRTPDTSIGTGLATNDPITLRSLKGAKILDSWSAPFNPGNGVSAEKIDLVVGDIEQNWIASPCKASPGVSNCAAGGANEKPPISPLAVVVSEVMLNALNESTGEFVELFNSGSVGVDLAGYWLSDGDAIDQIIGYEGGDTLLAPGKFAVILDPNYAGEYTISPKALLLTVTNSTLGNGLTNTDPVTLFEPDALTIVSSFSFPFNAGNGHSIEKVTLTSGDVADNWVGSPCLQSAGDNNDYSSPGERNCSDPYGGITGTKTVGQACPFGATDCLSGLCATETLTGNTFCTTSCDGDTPCSTGFDCAPTGDANYPNVCIPVSGGALPSATINEILYDNEGKDTNTWVELWGPPDTILDGVQLVGVNGSNGNDYHTINLTGLIGADGYFLIVHPSAVPGLLALADMTSTRVDFQNGPDSVQLRYNGTVLDSVGYGSFDGAVFAGEGTAADAPATGQSLARAVDGADTDDNAADFVVLEFPTPGATNFVPVAYVAPTGLLLTEIVVQPTLAEYIEIHNPTDAVIDLSFTWLADYSDYYMIASEMITGDGGAPSSSDFRVRFPMGATLEAGAYATVALDPAADFETAYGFAPTYDLSDMTGKSSGSSGLSNGDEMVVVFTWNPKHVYVYDVDYVVWGNTSDAMDKSAVGFYFDDTAPESQDAAASPNTDAFGLTRCDLTEGTEVQTGGNGLLGSDETSENLSTTWTVESATPGAPGVCE